MSSNETTAASESPQPARQEALNTVLRRLVATPPTPHAGAAAPPKPTPPGPVPRWLTAPVLRLTIPDSPFGAGTTARPTLSPPQPKPEPEAAATEVLDVPPLVEPMVEPKPEPIPDLAARMSEIAAVAAQAPEAIAAVAVDLSVLKGPDPPAPTPATSQPTTPPATSQPTTPLPPPSPRSEPPPRVLVRRTRPRVGRPRVDRPQRRIAPPPPPKRIAPARPADRAAPARSAAPPRPARAAPPVRERPALAPAATAVARTLRTAAVPETRPLAQNRRLYRRVRLSAELEIAGKPCRLVDLSIGGFAAAAVDKLDPGAVVPVTLRLTIDGISIGTEFKARMVYGNGARAAGRFVELTGAQTAFLRYIVTWRGEAIGAVGTTTLLDAITRWPERAFQPHPSTVKPAEPERPGFWSRLVSCIPLLGWRRRD